MELAQIANIAVNSLRLYEANKRQPRPDTLEQIASVLGISVGCLLGYEEEHVIIPDRLKIIAVDDPELENFQYRIEAKDEDAFNIGLQIIGSAGIHIQDLTAPGRISAALGKLNEKGQAVAVERIEELTKIPDYQCATQLPECSQDAPDSKK